MKPKKHRTRRDPTPGSSRRYTIRGMPAAVHRALRARARSEGRSLNEIVIEAVSRERVLIYSVRVRDLSDVVGEPCDDDAFEEVRRAHEQIGVHPLPRMS